MLKGKYRQHTSKFSLLDTQQSSELQTPERFGSTHRWGHQVLRSIFEPPVSSASETRKQWI